MKFTDSLAAPPPPPPPAAPKLPYSVKEEKYGIDRTRLVKIFPNGLADGLTGEELAVLKRVMWLEQSIATGKPLPDSPAMPYEAKLFPFGYNSGRERLAKVYPASANRIGGHWLTDDELAVHAYVQHLEAELAKKVAETPPGLATETSAIAPAVAGEVEEIALKAVSNAGATGAAAIAETFLREVLASGPVPAAAVAEQATAAGISESTLKRAKAELGVVSEKRGLAGWMWSLPIEGDQAEEVPHTEEAQEVEEGQPVPA